MKSHSCFLRAIATAAFVLFVLACASVTDAIEVLLPNGDFSSSSLTHGTGEADSLDQGWYAKNADNGVRADPAPINWSSGATVGAAGILTKLSNSGSKSRAGIFFTKDPRLVGTGWSFEFDLGGTSNLVEGLRIWAGNLAGSPTGRAFNSGSDTPPADSLVDGNGWTEIVNFQDIPGTPAQLTQAITEDLGGFDVMVLKIRGRSSANGSTFDNLRFVNPSIIDASPALEIEASGDDLVFTWDSQSGKLYDLLGSTDLEGDGDPATWTPWQSDIVATPDSNVETFVRPAAKATFFVLLEKDVPPPPPLFEEDFEEGDGGFTVKIAGATGSAWAHGDPDSIGIGGVITTGNGESANCWGTDIGNPGIFVDPTVTCLRSPVIDLGDVAVAELSFAQALDLDAGDTAVVNIIEEATDVIIATAVYTAVDGDGTSSDWEDVSGVSLPVGGAIRIEWCLTGFGGFESDFMGWYIDDVRVIESPN